MNTVLTTGTQISKDDFINAAENDNVQVIQDYIKSRANVNVQQEYGWTALHYTSTNGNAECLKLLINAAGADLSVQENGGDTALHHASWKGRTECVSLLITKNAELNVQNNDGWTALQGMRHLVGARLSVSNSSLRLGRTSMFRTMMAG